MLFDESRGMLAEYVPFPTRRTPTDHTVETLRKSSERTSLVFESWVSTKSLACLRCQYRPRCSMAGGSELPMPIKLGESLLP